VGEISLLDDGPRTATATTLTPCELLRVNNSQFDSLLETSPAIRQRLQEAMEARLGRMDAEAQ
jgi:CRP/FNR family cyclic AMP-dependent transcriptional regulator